MAIIESKRRAPSQPDLPGITEEQRLADALVGRIRMRAHDNPRPYVHRRMATAALRALGVPLRDHTTQSYDVTRGVLACFRLREDMLEYVWSPDPNDKLKASVMNEWLLAYPGERL